LPQFSRNVWQHVLPLLFKGSSSGSLNPAVEAPMHGHFVHGFGGRLVAWLRAQPSPRMPWRFPFSAQ
jgi:hypothetical protein